LSHFFCISLMSLCTEFPAFTMFAISCHAIFLFPEVIEIMHALLLCAGKHSRSGVFECYYSWLLKIKKMSKRKPKWTDIENVLLLEEYEKRKVILKTKFSNYEFQCRKTIVTFWAILQFYFFFNV
jgi:hypothetical protein